MTVDTILQLAIQYGLRVLGAVLILVVGWALSGWTSRIIRRLGDRSERLDRTIVLVFARLARWVVMIFTMIAVLNRFGVQTTSIVALLGAAGLAIGLALQGALGNVAAGLMILGLRPFRVGDAIEVGGTTGVVDDIGLFVTRMHTYDNVAVYVPNSSVWGREIRNFSQNPTRRVDLLFGIGYGDDIGHATRVIKEVIQADERVLAEPEPLIAVDSLGDNSVNLLARPWVERANAYAVKLDLTRRIKERFDEEGISIPFPQRDVHLL